MRLLVLLLRELVSAWVDSVLSVLHPVGSVRWDFVYFRCWRNLLRCAKVLEEGEVLASVEMSVDWSLC